MKKTESSFLRKWLVSHCCRKHQRETWRQRDTGQPVDNSSGVKAPAAKSDDRSSNPRPRMVEGDNWFPPVVLWPPNECHGTHAWMAHMHAHMCTHTNKWMFKWTQLTGTLQTGWVCLVVPFVSPPCALRDHSIVLDSKSCFLWSIKYTKQWEWTCHPSISLTHTSLHLLKTA